MRRLPLLLVALVVGQLPLPLSAQQTFREQAQSGSGALSAPTDDPGTERPGPAIPTGTKPSSVDPRPVDRATREAEDAAKIGGSVIGGSVIGRERPSGDRSDRQPLPAAPVPQPLPRWGSLSGQPLPVPPDFTPGLPSTMPPLREVLVTSADRAAAEALRRSLAPRGITIVSRRHLVGLGFFISTFRVPDAIDIDDLLEELRGLRPPVHAERNQRYWLMSALPGRIEPKPLHRRQLYAQHLLGLSYPSTCRQPLVIAMFDSRVDAGRAQWRASHLQVHDFAGQNGVQQAASQHGSGVASLLVANSPDFVGVLPDAVLHVFNVFIERADGVQETHTNWLLAALDSLATLTPSPLAVNLSFGGSDSHLLKMAIQQLSARMVFVAAAGNNGSDDKIYPAAYPFVYAVGAVDAGGRRTPQSNFGDHVQLYAPGEDVWTLDQNGRGYFASGTSFAAPFATAALGLVRQRGDSVPRYVKSLRAPGLVSFASLCGEA